MSSARNRRQNRDNAFDSSHVLTTEETASAIFGSIADVDAGRQVAKPISIFEIYPDPLQPRRVVPTPVRSHWDGRPSTTAALFSHWHLLAKEERGRDFNLEPYVLAADDVTRPEKIGPIDSALLDVAELAANIRSGGLINPITVVRSQQTYRLETGERRWLAYHLLYLMFENEQDTWGRIPARLVDEFSVWRQAGENNARANLNAIGKARQLAILLMNLYEQRGTKFLSYDEIVPPGGLDRLFYAQVAEGQGKEGYPIPYGTSEQILNAMGLKQTSQIREYRNLLRLPDVVWQIADDLSWTQGKIRELERQSFGSDSILIGLALTIASDEGYKFLGPPPPALLDEEAEEEELENALISEKKYRRFRSLLRLAKRVGEGSAIFKDKEVHLDDIKAMRSWLSELEQFVRNQSKSK